MFFKPKKEPVDIRDLPRNVSAGKTFVAKDGYGFVDLTKKRKLPSEIAKEKMLLKSMPGSTTQSSESTSSFSFFDTPTPNSTSSSSYPTSAQTSYPSTTPQSSDTEELLRKISSQISDLDTKLYKIEQRVDLLERKAGVSNSTNSSFSW
jgi:hypothetical protein